jgi:hypothetical protein
VWSKAHGEKAPTIDQCCNRENLAERWVGLCDQLRVWHRIARSEEILDDPYVTGASEEIGLARSVTLACARRVRPGSQVTQARAGACLAEGVAAIGATVIGHDALRGLTASCGRARAGRAMDAEERVFTTVPFQPAAAALVLSQPGRR